ncbi:TIGR02302 family protein [Roseivivax sediminis]|uniref:TIGR02302 family protein n=1 Tax=Roseivivax sediminis TaxID=936889 RepID=A0A1I1U201_9RHOB|nr:TIGR02302 family protein [Roseivivax sediminis]SFD64734.1 TIGR02302 family protein [Roseivivax sediminis]
MAETDRPDTPRAETSRSAADILSAVARPLALTRLGMVAERIVRAFWPLWSVLFVTLAALMLGLQDLVTVEVVWAAGLVVLVAAGWTLWRGIRRFVWPTRAGALARLDATMVGYPIRGALDRQAIGDADSASAALWSAYQARMRARLKEARGVRPDLRVAAADPFALRYVALLALCTALLFGSVLRVESVTGMGPGGGSELASGPSWEGWIEPPAYTRKPALYLNDISAAEVEVPEGAQVTLRMYGAPGNLSVSETVSGRPFAQSVEEAEATAQEFAVAKSGQLAVDGPGGRAWDVVMLADSAPQVERAGAFETTWDGEATLPFRATDDHGVASGTARITLALSEVDRRHGLERSPEDRPAIEIALPMPIAGDRAAFEEAMVDNFSQHPWANLPVEIALSVTDDAGQTGTSEPEVLTLPGRRFFDPMAASVIEARRDLLWNRENADDVAMVLRAVSHRPDDVFRKAKHFLRMRTIRTNLEAYAEDGLSDEERGELSTALWDFAVLLEDGDLDDARERLARAQERLNEAMRNGASEQEIAELMQELRQATDDYMRQLAQQAQRESEENPDMAQNPGENMMQMSQNDLQEMMDRIQELMEQGRMAEAQQALEELQQMMENMRVTQGQGQGQQSPGDQAMDDLAETLREQQDLSDQAFRDFQEQFNPGQQRQGEQGEQGQQQGQPGQQPGQGQQQGRGQGQQQGQGQGQGQQPGQGQGGEQSLGDSLADRQGALREELNRQRQNLPGGGSEAGDRAAEALDRAEGAMDGAERALREDDLAEAIDRQSEAMEALREGMRNLGESMAEQQDQQQGQPGEQGTAQGQEPGQQQDPLGRDTGSNGQVGTNETMLQGEDVYRRARELLDEIRRRSGEGERPDEELEYLERLLDRF